MFYCFFFSINEFITKKYPFDESDDSFFVLRGREGDNFMDLWFSWRARFFRNIFQTIFQSRLNETVRMRLGILLFEWMECYESSQSVKSLQVIVISQYAVLNFTVNLQICHGSLLSPVARNTAFAQTIEHNVALFHSDVDPIENVRILTVLRCKHDFNPVFVFNIFSQNRFDECSI